MFKISNITDYPFQKKTLSLPDGNQIELTIKYIDMQNIWIIEELVFNDIIIKGIQIVTNPNILREFRNILSFGILIRCDDNRDPFFVKDFAEDKVQMFLLSKEECNQLEVALNDR